MVWCSNCAKNIQRPDYVDGKICCSLCGRVLDEDNFSSEPTFSKNAAGQSQLSGNYVKTVQSDYSASRERILTEAYNGIESIMYALGIDGGDSISRPALAFYTIAVERNFTRGRRKEQVEAACLYIACRENKKPYLLIDFSEYLRINVYVLGAVFLQLCKLLSLEEHPIVQKPVDPSLFIHRFTDRLFGGRKPIVSRTALHIVASMKRDWMQTGRKPSGLCGAALYISALSHGLKCSKSDIGEIKSREEEEQWLGEKRIWISGIENAKENGESLVLDDGQENKIETNSERPAHLFEKGYSRRTKDIAVMPPDSNTSLDDTTMLSNESSKIDTKVCTSSESLDSYPNIDQNRRYPLRERKEPDRLGFSKASNVSYPISDFISYHRLSKANFTFALQLSSVYVPSHFQEALDDPKWKDAMVEEMMALQKNSTWEMVELPMGKKTVGCKWVFNVKYKSDGTVERYKARLVAKGYTQTYGIDYQETFAPVAKMNTVRVILSLAVNLDWPLRQFDVKNAFLHGELTEEVFMDPPQGFTLEEGKVCRLKKALYGLKQSPRAWFGRLSHAMEEYGFKQASADHTLFHKRNYNDITVLLVYVDDMIVTGNNKEEIENLRSYLAKEFEIKDLGTLKYFLGIEVSRSKQGLFLSQRKYTLELLAETGMSACEPIDTPIEVNHGLAFFSDQIPTNKERYQRIVGRLIYLTHTRPDLAYAVSVVSQFMHNPSDQHMNAVNRILAYLKSAPGKGVLFSKHEHFDVVGYTDSDFAGSKLDRKSTSGYLAFVGGNLVSWKSKKQNVVSLSSAEAEYRAMHHAITELSWLKILLKEIGFGPKGSMVLFCDNMAAIKIANNPVQHDRTKHVEIDRNYIKDNLDSGTIEIPYTRSSDQLADIMTHAVTSSLFNASLSKLGICDIYAPT